MLRFTPLLNIPHFSDTLIRVGKNERKQKTQSYQIKGNLRTSTAYPRFSFAWGYDNMKLRTPVAIYFSQGSPPADTAHIEKAGLKN